VVYPHVKNLQGLAVLKEAGLTNSKGELAKVEGRT
jgi:hypothetical protein